MPRILLCQAESADTIRAFVESCRYPHHSEGVDPSLPSPVERMQGATRQAGLGRLGLGTRGCGSELTAAEVWGLAPEEYLARCDPWPLNPMGELLLGIKLESPEGIAKCEEIIAVPGIGFAEMGPGDLGLALGYLAVPHDPYPPEIRQARERVFAACRQHRVPFLETCSSENIAAKLDEGVRVVAGHREENSDYRTRSPKKDDAGVKKLVLIEPRPAGSGRLCQGLPPHSENKAGYTPAATPIRSSQKSTRTRLSKKRKVYSSERIRAYCA